MEEKRLFKPEVNKKSMELAVLRKGSAFNMRQIDEKRMEQKQKEKSLIKKGTKAGSVYKLDVDVKNMV
jgi:hypothetical protein